MSSQDDPCPKQKKPKAGAPAWMVTYSDLVTLLLTFFVLLLSMANMDPVRFMSASNSIKQAFGISPPSPTAKFSVPVIHSPPISTFSPILQANTERIHKKIKNQIESLRLNDQIELIEKDGDIIILRLNDSILFELGKTELSTQSYLLLRNVADIIRPLPVLVRIEGHSDDIVGREEINNWNVSAGRAVSVMRFFHRSNLMDLDRMSAVGYGDSRPITDNVDNSSRAQNRRVDFVLQLKPPEKIRKKDPLLPM